MSDKAILEASQKTADKAAGEEIEKDSDTESQLRTEEPPTKYASSLAQRREDIATLEKEVERLETQFRDHSHPIIRGRLQSSLEDTKSELASKKAEIDGIVQELKEIAALKKNIEQLKTQRRDKKYPINRVPIETLIEETKSELMRKKAAIKGRLGEDSDGEDSDEEGNDEESSDDEEAA